MSGRPLSKPVTPAEGLAQVLREGTRWLARCELAVATCEAAPSKYQNAASQKIATDVRELWNVIRRTLPKHAKRLQEVVINSQPTSSKAKTQPRSATNA